MYHIQKISLTSYHTSAETFAVSCVKLIHRILIQIKIRIKIFLFSDISFIYTFYLYLYSQMSF